MGVEGDPNPVFPRRTECGENLVNEVVRTNDNKFSEDEDSLKGRWRCLRRGVDREQALFAGPRKPARVVRRFDARGDLIASEQHLQEEIPGNRRRRLPGQPCSQLSQPCATTRVPGAEHAVSSHTSRVIRVVEHVEEVHVEP